MRHQLNQSIHNIRCAKTADKVVLTYCSDIAIYQKEFTRDEVQQILLKRGEIHSIDGNMMMKKRLVTPAVYTGPPMQYVVMAKVDWCSMNIPVELAHHLATIAERERLKKVGGFADNVLNVIVSKMESIGHELAIFGSHLKCI